MRRLHTWQKECLFVGALLAVVAYQEGAELKSWACALAVWVEFGEATIVDRLTEEHDAEALRRHAAATRKLLPYTVVRESAWLAYFLLTGAHAAIVGCAVFLLYPLWRKAWRRGHPRAS